MDREKVIKALECCLKESDHLYSNPCNGCPYEGKECIDRMKADALALLKEQGKRKFLIDEQGNITPLPEIVRCKDCKYYPDGKGTTKWLPCREIIVPPKWFCADGKRKNG